MFCPVNFFLLINEGSLGDFTGRGVTRCQHQHEARFEISFRGYWKKKTKKWDHFGL